MKLSDIDDIKKLAAEFIALRKFEMFFEGRTIDGVKLTISDTRSMDIDLVLTNRNTITASAFSADLEAVVRKHRELLQTKLAMVGIDDFEELSPKK